MTTFYDRKQVDPSDAWLLDSKGRIVGVELARANAQKTYLPGATTEVGEIDGTFTGSITGGSVAGTNTANAGTAGTGVTAVEYGDGNHHTTVLTLNTTLPAVVGSLGVGKLIYTFPAGAQIVYGSRMAVGITQTGGLINANTPIVGLGHVVASGAVVILSGTATFQSINVGKAAADCTGTATVQTAGPTVTPFTYITESGGVKSVYFNAAVAWAGADAGPLLTGTVTIDWSTLA